MYLFNRNGNKAEVYKLIADADRIRKYREQEISKLGEGLISFAVTNHAKILEKKDVLTQSDIYYKNGKDFHKFIMDMSISHSEEFEIIENYINGFYVDKRVIKLLKLVNEEYFLLTSDFYEDEISNSFKIFIMYSILKLPKSLYLLQKLEQGRFNELVDEDIKEQLTLFELERVFYDELNKNYFRKLNWDEKEAIRNSKIILQRKLNGS